MQNSEHLKRIILIIKTMNTQDINSLERLNKATAIPKPSLHRILLQLIEMGLVIKHPDTHLYSITSDCDQLSSGVNTELKVIESATELATQVTAQHEWPLAIATVYEDHMVIRASTRASARFSFIKSTVGKKFPLIGSALGEIWLANQSKAKQRKLLQSYSQAAINRRLKQLNSLNIYEYLKQVKTQGYALRIGSSGESSHLSVPIFYRRKVIASLGISVFSNTVKDNIVPLYLSLLEQNAQRATAHL